MLHTVVAVTDLQESFEFYTEVLGFRESDRVLGRSIFLRGGIGWHHSLVIVGQRGEPHLDHVAFLLDGFDDLMRARAFAMDGGVPLARDLLRHPTSGSASIYLTAEPSSVMLELCFDHARITDPNHRPRGLTLNQWANNVWLPPKG
jgi:catechol 2,3-dioxygenase-like lactoylglutathione lyase family enzyme